MNIDHESAPWVHRLHELLTTEYRVFAKVVPARAGEFGAPWVESFEGELRRAFEDDPDALEGAVGAYSRFSLEAMRLQIRFDQTLRYTPDSYDAAVADVYLNDEYMTGTYLPALLLSHYMWPHHYRQRCWTHERLVPLLDGAQTFCDVGIGTGFYSKELLGALPGIRGWGFDISESSIRHTQDLLERWGSAARYELCRRHVTAAVPGGFDAFVCVELLEHLDDPVAFLRELRSSVARDAIGLVTAAIDAPNRDHIYLYRNLQQIDAHLGEAGFETLEAKNFAAYTVADKGQTVPQSGCFIVRAK